MFKQIIVGIDGSEQSKSAALVACDLAKHYDATVTLVHIPHGETVGFVVGAAPGYRVATTKPSFAEVEEAGQKVLDACMKTLAAADCGPVKTYMQHGDPAAEVLAYADEIGADLIVTGRRGLGRVSSLILGSTTQKINHLAKCACLSVA
ncbi:MAG: universal stress protein [Pseudomonadota bacterium]